jgi:hypothetical protein
MPKRSLQTGSCCALAALIAFLVGACAANGGPLADQVPLQFGGLPAGTPARPPTVAPFPAVHDLPPPRSTEPLSDSDQLRLEKDLAAVRSRQQKLQDPNARQRADTANAANKAAMDRAAKAAAKMKPVAPQQ